MTDFELARAVESSIRDLITGIANKPIDDGLLGNIRRCRGLLESLERRADRQTMREIPMGEYLP